MTIRSAAIIGLGEAGSVFAAALRDQGVVALSAYDILIEDASQAAVLRERARTCGADLAASAAAAVAGADLVISTVTPDQAAAAAGAASAGLGPGQRYLDLNSCPPSGKRAAAAPVEAAGAAFIEAVAMERVLKCGHRVPVLACGPQAAALAADLRPLGFDLEPVSDDYGAASSIKLLRSVVVKGIETLLAEALLGAERLGASERILASLGETYPGVDWPATAAYHLGGLAKHGKRRAAELAGSAEVLESLGIEPLMARAVSAREQWSADLELRDRLKGRAELSPAEFALIVKDAASQ